MTTLSDQAERDRFIESHGKNISVIAPAGVGKTHAIVQRILAIARLPEDIAVDRLKRLIVVTYSVRAAQQMQERARTAIRQAGISARVQRAFQQTFFGTIHSYCVRLLDRFGHYLGLPSPVALLQDEDEFWNRFLVRGLKRGTTEDDSFQELFHFFAPEKLYALGRDISPGMEILVGPSPALDLSPVLGFPVNGLHHATKKSLQSAQESVLRWSESWAKGDRFYPLPKCPETKQADFVEAWLASFAPLHAWLSAAAMAFGRRVANAYENFRLGEAVITYDDQVRIARRLLEEPGVQKELADERPSVLLDEAQDTDPRQFELLLRVAGCAPGAVQGDDQSFSIVGDFQQSIYAPRSDPAFYKRVHDELILEPRGACAQLEVTFRCDEAIICFVNKIFPGVLHGLNGQSKFYQLRARDGAGPGQVTRWLCPDEPQHAAGAMVKAEVRARHEARFLAERIRDLGFTGLGADSWSQVAILCPRRAWLLQIARELRELEVPVQFHSSNETQGARTPVAWLTALVWIAAHPEDSFEIVGVLREILGISDHDIARFTQGNGDRLRLDLPSGGEAGHVARVLQLLCEAIHDAERRPLHHAVERLVEKTALRARLESISEFEPEDSASDLDDLLASIFQRAAAGATLSELATELRRSRAQRSVVEEEPREAVQLLTSHKSKGLEWQTVIVPYIFRPIEEKIPPYPRLEHLENGREIVVRDKVDFAAHAKPWVEERGRQQLQRLLYVTCTRAKKTLLLVDDQKLFEGHKHRGGWSSAELLGFLGGVNRIAWEALPETLGLPVADKKIADGTADKTTLSFSSLSKKDVARALKHVREIPRRVTPHALAIHPPVESEPEAQFEREEEVPDRNPGILYGTWWHEFVQTIPWEKPREAWQPCFDRALTRSPQPERSRREWELFCGSTLAQWICQPGLLIQREIPFLWNAEECLEGVIDLAVFVPGESAWHVIDWKTNRATEGMVEIYRGQIEAYARVMKQMLSAEVKGSLYLTSNGQWLPVE